MFNIWLGTRHMAKYLAGFRIYSQIFGRIPNTWPNIWQDTGYIAKYVAGYRIYGQISGRIPDIWPKILPDTGCMAKYLAGYRIHGYRISGPSLILENAVPVLYILLCHVQFGRDVQIESGTAQIVNNNNPA